MSGEKPEIIIGKKGTQITDSAELEYIVEKVLAANQNAVADFKSGKESAIVFLVGQVMSRTKGRANPKLVNELLRKRLGEEK